MRIPSESRRKVAATTYATPSSRPTVLAATCGCPRYVIIVVRAITPSDGARSASALMSSSCMPSASNASSASGLRLSKGSTATRGAGGGAPGEARRLTTKPPAAKANAATAMTASERAGTRASQRPRCATRRNARPLCWRALPRRAHPRRAPSQPARRADSRGRAGLRRSEAVSCRRRERPEGASPAAPPSPASPRARAIPGS